MSQDPSASIRQVAFLGNYAPRRCGIATFTTDLSDAIAAELPDADCAVIAMNDPGMRHDYGERVRFEIAESDLSSYRRAADFLNVGGTDVLCVQHEYGIFGGKAGSHLLALLHDVSMPVVTTLHTLLRTPSDEQRQVLDDIARVSTRLVVMSRYGADLLQEVHGVSPDKIDLIPHGIPHSRPVRASKMLLGLEGQKVILTFGLLSPDKGIEYVIQALPEIVRRHPNAVYVVVGATHPHVLEHTGDSYRRSLELLAHRLGVEANLVFHDRFVSLPELIEFLAAADIYVTPYLNSEQVASGTLAYAVGAGKAVVSTRYPYAVELLADGRGILVPNRDAGALGDAIAGLFADPAELARVSARAAAYGTDMVWPSVAQKYIRSFERASAEHSTSRRALFEARTLAKRPMRLPELNVDHLRLMTDGTGILQHAAFATPRYADGYCLDDNARALMLMALIEEAKANDPGTTRELASRYLAFVAYAFNPEVGRFRNFMSYDRRWREQAGSEDSQGRALWALGAVVGRSRDPGRRTLAGDLFHAALPAMATLQSPRAWAFALLGIDEYLRAFQGDSGVEALRARLADRLLESFTRYGHDDWRWCEDVISYDNARLPQALIVSGNRMDRPDMTLAGMRSLEWLATLQSTRDGHFEPIGSNGFYRRGTERARFDQQPIEACAMVSACREAWLVTRDGRWLTEMRTAFRWFLGHNSLQTPLYDSATGGCRDGLHADRPNQNQGAESTLSFLLALTELRAFESEIRLHDVYIERNEAREHRPAAE
jgi:glycosyltransferase involved in cell wall biosynthesis